MMAPLVHPSRWRTALQWLAPLALCLLPTAASASFLQGEALDNFAMGMAWVVICVVPIAAIVVFWKLHVLPEKIAHKRHHPQKDAIHVLCLLSLAVGGLLWPLAWLWAYTKPTGYMAAYGTDLHEDHYLELADRLQAGELSSDEIDELRDDLDAMAAKSRLPAKLRALRKTLAAADAVRPAPDLAGGNA
jgi:hypothetical protein